MEISEVLSSRARFEVLKVVSDDPTPLRIRALERRTGLSIRSVQVALDGLVKAKVVTRESLNKNPVYRLNESHGSFQLIQNIFKAVQMDKIQKRSQSYHSKAERTWQFVSEAGQLLRRSRS